MKIIDLTEQYIKTVLKQNDFARYYNYYPTLFNHYFLYWADKKNNCVLLNKEEIIIKKQLIKQAINKIEKILTKQKIKHANLKIILFIGQNTTNGHAFNDNGEFAIWIPLEAYTTNKQAEIFIAHEIVHCLHYKLQPEFYFSDVEEKNNTGRQLMTEGIATIITKTIESLADSEVLWADYLTREKIIEWLENCEKKYNNLAKLVLEHWDKPDIAEIFMANDPKNILAYRGGYYLALKIIEKIVIKEKLSPIGLLQIPRNELNKKFLQYLSEGDSLDIETATTTRTRSSSRCRRRR